jgi:hypothetical protein
MKSWRIYKLHHLLAQGPGTAGIGIYQLADHRQPYLDAMDRILDLVEAIEGAGIVLAP